MGQHDLALEEFQHAYSLDPRNALALTGMAHTDEDAGKLAEAEAAYRKAADLQPNDWDGVDNLALFLDRHGKYSEAIAEFRHALHLAPDNAQVLFNLGAAYIDSGDPKSFPEAETSLKRSIAVHPSFAAYGNLGALYNREHRYQEAVDQTLKALQLNDKNYVVWDNLRADYQGLNQPDRAADALAHETVLVEQAVRLNPRDANTFAKLADLYAFAQQRDKAASTLRTAVALAPEDPDVLLLAADVHEHLGERQQAIACIQKSLQHGANKQQIATDPELQDLLKDPPVRALLK
jgi:tetratricopeptide (TPR) repeat protein